MLRYDLIGRYLELEMEMRYGWSIEGKFKLSSRHLTFDPSSMYSTSLRVAREVIRESVLSDQFVNGSGDKWSV